MEGKAKLIEFVDKHLRHDLRWLLCATATWEFEKEPFPHIKLYSEIASFTFARTLFEFFTTKNPEKFKSNITWKSFELLTPLESTLYEAWKTPIDKFVMHPDERNEGGNIKNGKELKKMPLYFSNEIIRLWDEFTQIVHPIYSEKFKEIKNFSIKRAKEINSDSRVGIIINEPS